MRVRCLLWQLRLANLRAWLLAAGAFASALSRGAPFATEIAELFDAQLTPQTVTGERQYLAAPTVRGFERPYG
jgi:hypothetical protein